MVQSYTQRVKALLLGHGCSFVRSGKGDHEVWISPRAARPFVVDGRIMSRHTANAELTQAGVKARF